MNHFIKHRQLISGFFLCVYLFLFGISITHNHDFKLSAKNLLSNHSGSKSVHKDPFSADGSFCLLAHLNKTLSTSPELINDFTICFYEVARYSVQENILYSSKESSAINLRAPPKA